jgi:hypothetical protein
MARAVVFYSGAAAALDAVPCLDEHLRADLYGVPKLEEERRVSKIVDTLVLRAYAVSGCLMNNPENFALGDFLLHVLRGLPIEIRAPMPVICGYGTPATWPTWPFAGCGVAAAASWADHCGEP